MVRFVIRGGTRLALIRLRSERITLVRMNCVLKHAERQSETKLKHFLNQLAGFPKTAFRSKENAKRTFIKKECQIEQSNPYAG